MWAPTVGLSNLSVLLRTIADFVGSNCRTAILRKIEDLRALGGKEAEIALLTKAVRPHQPRLVTIVE